MTSNQVTTNNNQIPYKKLENENLSSPIVPSLQTHQTSNTLINQQAPPQVYFQQQQQIPQQALYQPSYPQYSQYPQYPQYPINYNTVPLVA